MKHKTLVILDYSSSEVHFYEVAPHVNIDDEYIVRLGFNLDECYWMLGENIGIQKHKGVLI